MNRWRAWALWLTGVAGVLFVHLGMACGQVPCSYQIAHVIQGPYQGPFWGYPPTTGMGISPNGHYVVGYYELGSGYNRAWVFDTQTSVFSILPWPGPAWYSMTAVDCNDSGIIVGDGWDDDASGGRRGWIYNLVTQQYTIIEPLGGSWSLIAALNSSGAVCGYRSNTFVEDPANPYEAFIWQPDGGGQFTNLGVLNGPKSAGTDISDDGTVVGWTGGNSLYDYRAFVYSNGEITVLPPVVPGGSSEARATNGRLVVGYGRLESDVFAKLAFVYDMETRSMVTIPTPPEFRDGICQDVSPTGNVVGEFSYGNPIINSSRPFLWTNGAVLDLATMVPTGDIFTVRPLAIDQAGQLTGNTINAVSDVIGFVVTPDVYSSPADVDVNCRVDIDDLLMMVNDWGETESPADVNHDRIVNIDDFLILINNWTLE